MSKAPALWTKHRPIALGLAARYRIPGLDHEDVRQEALIALWQAARTHNPAQGPFPPYARAVVDRTLIDLLRSATREKRTARLVELEDVPAADQSRLLQDTLELLPTLTALERQAVAAQLDGSYTSKDRRMENALGAARRKLRAA